MQRCPSCNITPVLKCSPGDLSGLAAVCSWAHNRLSAAARGLTSTAPSVCRFASQIELLDVQVMLRAAEISAVHAPPTT